MTHRRRLAAALFPLVAALGCSTPVAESAGPQSAAPQSAAPGAQAPKPAASVTTSSGVSSPGEASVRTGGPLTRPKARIATIRHALVPALSPNGRFVAYADERAGRQSVVVLDRQSGMTRALRRDSAGVSSLQVSNNGRWVAFIDDAQQPIMADLDHSSSAKIGPGRGEVLAVSMTADASRLAFVVKDAARPSGTGYFYDRLTNRLHQTSSRALESAISPDGSQLLTIEDGSPPAGAGQQPAPTLVARLLEVGTGFAKQLPPRVGTQPSLARGGRRIVSMQDWGRSDGGMGHAVVLEVASGRATRVTFGRAKPVISVISGNGRFVVARRFASADDAFSDPMVPTSVVRIDLRTGTRLLLTRRMIGTSRPATSASGRVIAWLTRAPGDAVPVVKVWAQTP